MCLDGYQMKCAEEIITLTFAWSKYRYGEEEGCVGCVGRRGVCRKKSEEEGCA